VPFVGFAARATTLRVTVPNRRIWPPAPRLVDQPGTGTRPRRHHDERAIMATTGYVGTVEVETRGVPRLWFSLTDDPQSGSWIRIGPVRAWFTMNLQAEARPSHLAQLTLLMEAMRAGLQVSVSHGGAAPFQKRDPNDSFEVDGVRILRTGLSF
jgi:hypothetical protein